MHYAMNYCNDLPQSQSIPTIQVQMNEYCMCILLPIFCRTNGPLFIGQTEYKFYHFSYSNSLWMFCFRLFFFFGKWSDVGPKQTKTVQYLPNKAVKKTKIEENFAGNATISVQRTLRVPQSRIQFWVSVLYICFSQAFIEHTAYIRANKTQTQERSTHKQKACTNILVGDDRRQAKVAMEIYGSVRRKLFAQSSEEWK